MKKEGKEIGAIPLKGRVKGERRKRGDEKNKNRGKGIKEGKK